MPPVLGEAKEGGKRAAPAYSITGRGKALESKGLQPGPGTYTTDKASTVLTKRPPAYTIAPRREQRPPTAAVPGPDVYCPEKVIRNFSDIFPSDITINSSLLDSPIFKMNNCLIIFLVATLLYCFDHCLYTCVK